MAADALEKSVDEIGLSAATAGTLKRAQMLVVRDLVSKTDADLLKTRGISRDRWKEIKAAVEQLGLSLGMRFPEASPAVPPPSEVALRFLAGDAATIEALASGDPATWQAWLEHLLLHKPAPVPSIIDRMLQREPSPATWLAIASRALFNIDSDVFMTAKTAMDPFQAWLGDGVIARLGPTARASLEIRLDREMREAKGSEAARAIVVDLRAAQSGGEWLGDALILLARRLAEEDAYADAIDALLEAEGIFGAASDGAALARRLRGANLLRLKRLDDAFEILDEEMRDKATARGGGAFRFSGTPEDSWEAALAEAAQVAAWALRITPEWVRALGGMAQHAPTPSKKPLWQRFERALVAMVDNAKNPGSDLEVVIRQAKQRKLIKTARAAEDLAKQRGIELVDNPHFG